MRPVSLPPQLDIHGSGSWAYRRTNTNQFNYWLTPDFTMKASYSLVGGNRFATLPVNDAAVGAKTRLLQLGAEFSS